MTTGSVRNTTNKKTTKKGAPSKTTKKKLRKELLDGKLDPQEYFDRVKSMKKTTNTEFLNTLEANSLVLLQKAYALGQKPAISKLLFTVEVITKEKTLLDQGFDTYVYKDDIDEFLALVENKSVKTIELKNYPREIPDEIAAEIIKLKEQKIFDEFFIVFTDYTDEVGKQVKAERKRKDPIIFGAFINDTNINDRFYYIGDWEDEYCDLTLAKMVSKMSDKGKTIEQKITIKEASIEEIQEYVKGLDDNNRRILTTPIKLKKPGIFGRIKLWNKK